MLYRLGGSALRDFVTELLKSHMMTGVTETRFNPQARKSHIPHVSVIALDSETASAAERMGLIVFRRARSHLFSFLKESQISGKPPLPRYEPRLRIRHRFHEGSEACTHILSASRSDCPCPLDYYWPRAVLRSF